jgi:hypothetical protein
VVLDTDGPSLAAFLVPGVVIPTGLLVLAFRAPTPRQVERWAASCGVTITHVNGPLVRAHLGRVRRWRSVAAFPFWWLSFLPMVVGSRFPLLMAGPPLGIVVYLAGGLVAELTVRPRRGGSVKQAPLAPRTARDYGPAWIRILPRVLLTVAALLVLVPRPDDTTITPMMRRGTLFSLAAGVALMILAEITMRRIVDRPQRSGDPDILAADDALRATGVSMAASIALLVAISACSAALTHLYSRVSGLLVAILLGAVLAGYGLSLALITVIVNQSTWGYRRRHRQTPPVAAVP